MSSGDSLQLVALSGWVSALLTAWAAGWRAPAIVSLPEREHYGHEEECNFELRELSRVQRDLEWWRALVWILLAALLVALLCWALTCCGFCVCVRSCCGPRRESGGEATRGLHERGAIALGDRHRPAPKGQPSRLVSGNGLYA